MTQGLNERRIYVLCPDDYTALRVLAWAAAGRVCELGLPARKYPPDLGYHTTVIQFPQTCTNADLGRVRAAFPEAVGLGICEIEDLEPFKRLSDEEVEWLLEALNQRWRARHEHPAA